MCNRAIRELGSLGSKAERAADRLAEIARNQPRVRWQAIEALGNIRSSSDNVISTLTGIAEGDENRGVRRKAVWALGRIGKEAVPALLKLLRNNDDGVFSESAKALERLDANIGPVVPYLELIKDDPTRGRHAQRLLKKTEGDEPDS